MCTFVPGEVIAIAPIYALNEIGDGLPGVRSLVRPLVSEEGGLPFNSELAQLGTLMVRTDPGSELYALSRVSARLAGAIEKKEAIVDLNHVLPLSAPDQAPRLPLRMTPHAEREVAGIRRILRSALPAAPTPRRIAVLDSGLAPEYVAHRELRYLDYSDGGRLRLNSAPVDPLGHGTRVVTILDQILPAEVELSIGRLPSDPGSLTALTVAHAFGDIVARERPQVVNLSISPRSDWFVCPSCRKRVPAPTFLSNFLPLVIRMGGRSTENTVTVMAAGNTGQLPNSRWLTQDVNTLLFAVAENQRGDRTRYSSAPEGPYADLYSAGAFGGDDPDDANAQGVFSDGTHGTSFAAPFVSAVALLSKDFHGPMVQGFPTHIGAFTRQLIDGARNGQSLRLVSATTGSAPTP
jgi:hypothetical protein